MAIGFRRMWQLNGRLVAAAVLLVGLLLPVSVAQAQIIPDCNPLPGQSGSGQQEPCGVKHILQLLINIYNVLLGLAAIVALLFIIWGAVRMFIWSVIEEPESELTAAKRTVTRAVVGFVLVLLAYLMVNTLVVVLGGGSLNDLLKPLR